MDPWGKKPPFPKRRLPSGSYIAPWDASARQAVKREQAERYKARIEERRKELDIK